MERLVPGFTEEVRFTAWHSPGLADLRQQQLKWMRGASTAACKRLLLVRRASAQRLLSSCSKTGNHARSAALSLQVERRGGVHFDVARDLRFYDFGAPYVRCPSSLQVSFDAAAMQGTMPLLRECLPTRCLPTSLPPPHSSLPAYLPF